MIAEIINVGSELLTGSTLNTHAQYLGRFFLQHGIPLYHTTTVGDNPSRLASSLSLALTRSDLVILTGGLGPTDDDISLAATVKLLGLKLRLHTPTLTDIQIKMRRAKKRMASIQKRQAWIPQNSTVIPNVTGTAPGICIETEWAQKKRTVVLLPGPPSELYPMVGGFLTQYVRKRMGLRQTLVKHTLLFPGHIESDIAIKVRDFLQDPPPVTMGIYAKPGLVRLEVIAAGTNAAAAERNAQRVIRQTLARFPGTLCLVDHENLQSYAVTLLRKKNLTLSLAESCTGGLVSRLITDVPGASQVYQGGVIAYDNRIKENLLQVPRAVLQKYGAVSSQAALSMAQNARKVFSTDLAISITGVAGPDGGTRQKPVGLVWIGLAGPRNAQTFRFNFMGNRDRIRQKSAMAALTLLTRHLLGYKRVDFR